MQAFKFPYSKQKKKEKIKLDKNIQDIYGR